MSRAFSAASATLNRDLAIPHWMLSMMGIGAFALLTALGAYVRIPLPFTPVPFTLQTLFVIAAPLALGLRRGVASQALYLALGAVGAPVFASAAVGALHFFGPTGGYLLGFVACQWVAASIAGRKEDASLNRLFAAALAGSLTILVLGTLWLKVLFGLGMTEALALGALPFIAGDVLKSAIAALVAFRARELFRF